MSTEVVVAVNGDVNGLILAAAAVGLIVNTMAVLGVAWRGGRVLGTIEQSVKGLSEDVGRLTSELQNLREMLFEHAKVIARVVTQLDSLETRVSGLERREEAR